MVSLLFSTVFTTYNNVAAARRSKHATSERLMVEAIPLAELAFRILILPPISRGTHFVGPNSGPKLQAQRVVEAWQVPQGDPVPLIQAFRLLDVPAVAGAILRGIVELEREGDPRYWTFPTLEELLPELRELAWQRMCAGSLLVEGIKGIRGKRHRSLLPAELPRLVPDWELSRLTRDGHDEFIDVRVQRAPAEPVKKAWREKPSPTDIKVAVQEIDRAHPLNAEPPTFDEFHSMLQSHFPDFPRDEARKALNYAPRLRRARGSRRISRS
jgi:hypothetical protein